MAPRKTCSIPGPVHDVDVTMYHIVDVAMGTRVEVTLCTRCCDRVPMSTAASHGRRVGTVRPAGDRSQGRERWAKYVRRGPGLRAGDPNDVGEG